MLIGRSSSRKIGGTGGNSRWGVMTRLASAAGWRKTCADWVGLGEVVCLEGVAGREKFASACERGFGRCEILEGGGVRYWKDGG